MDELDRLLADIAELEADPNAECEGLPRSGDDPDPLRPRDGETEAEFKARMLAEFDALNDADDSRDDGGFWWDAWNWRPATPEPAVPSYLIDPDLIHTIKPRGGQLRVSIGGRHIGTLNPAA